MRQITETQQSDNIKQKTRCSATELCDLYIGRASAVNQNNVCLGLLNMLFCGLGMCIASCCDPAYSKQTILCAGSLQFFSAFLLIGVIFSFASGLAMICEHSCW